MAILSCGYVLDANQNRLETTVLHPKAGRKAKMRLISEDIGQSLEEVKSLSQFLRVMYDACVVQRNLYRKCQVLHRDINDNNIMVAPTDLEFEHCDRRYNDSIKYINQVLAKDRSVKPEPACLVVDLGNINPGTPKFIARSVSQGELLPGEGYPTNQKAMPTLEGRALKLYKSNNEAGYTKYTEMVQKRAHVPATPQVEHKHQLFHDAESTFWVIAWTLTRSAPKDYKEEEEWPPALHRFVTAMETHQAGPDVPDYRIATVFGRDRWQDVLHPTLASVTGMLSQMHDYTHPEWQHRPELDVEHVHEALMRLLVAEIVRVEDSGADVGLIVGGRALPTVDPWYTSHMR
ncbi:hypothetical protein FRC10_007542 [Ceratobasidium sp. 414]|nr:hypothetical protein FRC10_007542 [Ceratobasidium sp. 414]